MYFQIQLDECGRSLLDECLSYRGINCMQIALSSLLIEIIQPTGTCINDYRQTWGGGGG